MSDVITSDATLPQTFDDYRQPTGFPGSGRFWGVVPQDPPRAEDYDSWVRRTGVTPAMVMDFRTRVEGANYTLWTVTV